MWRGMRLCRRGRDRMTARGSVVDGGWGLGGISDDRRFGGAGGLWACGLVGCIEMLADEYGCGGGCEGGFGVVGWVID